MSDRLADEEIRQWLTLLGDQSSAKSVTFVALAAEVLEHRQRRCVTCKWLDRTMGFDWCKANSIYTNSDWFCADWEARDD